LLLIEKRRFLNERWGLFANAPRRQRPFPHGLPIAATGLAFMFVGATLPTPLYPIYQQAFGFGGVTLTLIYAVYVLGNLAALSIFGRLSDQVGRRRVILPAIAIGVVSAIMFIFARSIVWLFAARALSGFATGLASGVATAWISELQPQKDKGAGAVMASAANFIGLAIGPLMAGTLARFGPWPLKLSFLMYILMLFAIGIAICSVPEMVSNPTRSWRELSLRPRFGVPRALLIHFVPPAVTAFVTFALIGFYAALIPSVLADHLHQRSPLVAGLVAFELFVVAALTTMLARNIKSRAAMLGALTLFPPCLGLLVYADLSQSMLLLLAAAAAGGIAASLGYRGSLQVVNGISPSDQRGEMVSSYFLFAFAGNSLPVIGVGLLATKASPGTAQIAFAVAIAVLAAVGLMVGRRYDPRVPQAISR
jgi:MFS family permease